MDYLLKRNNTYYYNRRIPAPIRPFIPKERIRIALRTDSRKTALRLARAQNEKTERYWKTLVDTGETYSHQHYKAVAIRAQQCGFTYYPAADLATQAIEQLIKRLLSAKKADLNPANVEAVLGGVPVPSIMLADALPRFWAITKDKLLNKSDNQKRKWRNPREKAWRNFLACLPNKPIQELTRDDMLFFRDWQMNRIEAGEIVAASANKDLKHAKAIIIAVAENNRIKLDETWLFKRLLLSEDDSQKRLPFDYEFLLNTFLNPERLKELVASIVFFLFCINRTTNRKWIPSVYSAIESEVVKIRAIQTRLQFGRRNCGNEVSFVDPLKPQNALIFIPNVSEKFVLRKSNLTIGRP